MLFFAEEPGETLYFIQQGLIKIFSLSEDGREKTLSLLEEGDAFGEMAVLDNLGRSANAQALHDAKLFLLYKNDFLKILQRYPELAHRMLYMLVRRLREADVQITELSFKNMRQRIALLFLRLGKKYGTADGGWLDFELGLSQEEIGHLTGCTRESVNRTLSFLAERSVFRSHQNRVSIQPEQLEALLPNL